MKRPLHPLFLAFAASSFCFSATAAQSNPYQAQELPPAKRAAHVEITKGPAIEVVRDDYAIIRWTSTNPGGADEHFALAHYGTDPRQLSLLAKSHIRLNRNHPETVFRVLVPGLKPKTTYYYTVDSMGGDGTGDGVKSPELRFTTP